MKEAQFISLIREGIEKFSSELNVGLDSDSGGKKLKNMKHSRLFIVEYTSFHKPLFFRSPNVRGSWKGVTCQSEYFIV